MAAASRTLRRCCLGHTRVVRADDAGDKQTGTRYDRDSVEFGRAIAFFDAVYAFAVTMLVVNIEPPGPAGWTSLDALLRGGVGEQILGFAISFVVIAVFWRVNHRLAATLSGISPGVIAVNLVATAFVVLIPFSTQGMSDSETSGAPLAAAVYAANISCAVLAQSAMHFVARSQGMLIDPLPLRADLVRFLDTLLTPIVFLASIPIAYAHGTDWARSSWAVLLVIGPLSGAWASRRVAQIVAAERAG